jgi:hypothetical protein
MTLFCQDCHKLFVFSEHEQDFFFANGWKKPVRCPNCRKVHKERRRDPYWGWESTMRASVPTKFGDANTALIYSIVGGFR